MSQQIYLDPRIFKKLDLLRRSGKKALLAATKTEEIVSRLQRGGIIPDKVGTVTKHGELRIKGVMKYDLGSGYRLITFKQGSLLFLLYVGTHDDCHRWIENNRELTVEQVEERCIDLPACECDDGSDDYQLLSLLDDEEEYDPLSDVSERELRAVFSGLVGG